MHPITTASRMLLTKVSSQGPHLKDICKQRIRLLQILCMGKQGQSFKLSLKTKHQISLYSLLQRQNNITLLLIQAQSSHFLPQREIPCYDGDPLQFKTFIKAFEHCVEAKDSSKGDCLYYVEQFKRGEPRDVFHSCLHMTPERRYTVAKHLLQVATSASPYPIYCIYVNV